MWDIFKDKNEFLFEILKAFKNETGIGMLINTSFNVHEEPIVESYEDAIKASYESDLDYLILDNAILEINKN